MEGEARRECIWSCERNHGEEDEDDCKDEGRGQTVERGRGENEVCMVMRRRGGGRREACGCVGDGTVFLFHTEYLEPFYKSTGFLISSKLLVTYCDRESHFPQHAAQETATHPKPAANVPAGSVLERGTWGNGRGRRRDL